ncbi:MAG: hypothetical protein KC713_10230, partial [Candidatus Omnitrophica bacterium]|nr:hypothetical protein [Candidatus Omnitrophota bacterium]
AVIPIFTLFVFPINTCQPKPRLRIALGTTLLLGVFLLRILYEAAFILDLNHYAIMFRYLPDYILIIRFLFSLLLRIVMLVTFIGVIHYSNTFRKVLIWICVFTLLTLFWKHPYQAFENINFYTGSIPFPLLLDKSQSILGGIQVNPEIFNRMIQAYLQDIFLYGAILIFFSNRHVKAMYQ